VSDPDIEALADQVHREHVGRQRRRRIPVEQSMNESKVVRTGRPTRLSHADEFNLYAYRKAGIAIKTCASMFRVSVPTANRIIAKFRGFDERIEPVAREFRERIESLRDST
jgi:hypothetical protein